MLAWALDAELRRRGSRVVVNSMTPRLCSTPLAERMGLHHGRSSKEGAAAVLFLATSQEQAALEGGWHWRDDTRRRCEFCEKEEDVARLAAAVEAAAKARLGDGAAVVPW